MAGQRVVQLRKIDLLPSLVGEFFDTSGQEKEAIAIHLPVVARMEEAISREGRLVGGWIRYIAGHDP